jgi:hypothetical protein
MCSDLNFFIYDAAEHVCHFNMCPWDKSYSTPLNYGVGRLQPFSSTQTRRPTVHKRTWCRIQIAAGGKAKDHTTPHRQKEVDA